MNLAKINEVIKASPAIQIQSRTSLLQRRAWNVLLANAYNKLLDRDIYSVTIPDLDGEIYLKVETHGSQPHGTVNVLDLVIVSNAFGKDARISTQTVL